MPITVLSDIIIPSSVIAAGVRGKNMRNNTRVTTYNGEQQVNVNWTRTIRQYELGVVPMLIAQWQQIEALYEVTDGGAFGMLLQDPKDDTADASAGKLYPRTNTANVGTAGLGYGVPTYNLIKRYGVTGTSLFKDRTITRPKGTPVVYKNSTPLTLGAGVGQFTFNSATGVITINATSSSAGVSFTPGATTVITFSSGVFPALFTIGGRLWLQSVTGTAAATLNDKSHLIINISGSAITLDVNTTGLTITAGQGAFYPQPADVLTWSGQFYVPVHFMEDTIDWDLTLGGEYENRLVAGPQVMLEEVRES
jgi:uncharacterized protein (TIGR02217 family)